MKTKAMRKRMIALTLAAATIFGVGAPALGGRARAAEATQLVSEVTDETQEASYPVSQDSIKLEAQTNATPEATPKSDVITNTNNDGSEGASARAEYSDPMKAVAFKYAQEAGMIALDKAIDMLFNKVPFLDDFLPSIKGDLKGLIGLGSGDQISTKDLMDRIETLEDNLNKAIDAQTNRLIKSMKDAFTEGTYRNDMKGLVDTAHIKNAIDTENTNYTEEDRLVQLAMVVGKDEYWDLEGNFIKQIIKVGSDLIGKNYMNNKNMFEILIETNKQEYQFTGEVIDAINPYVVKLMTDYLKYVAYALSSLTAQQMLHSKDFNPDNITDKDLRAKYEGLHNTCASIEGMKATIESMVFGRKTFDQYKIKLSREADTEDAYDNVMDSYKVFQNEPRNIHIPSGKAVATTFRIVHTKNLIDDSEEKTHDWGENSLESTNKTNFENRVQGGTGVSNNGNNNIFTAKEMNAIFNHVKKVVSEKRAKNPNYTAITFFKELGFIGLNGVTDNYRFIIGDGYEETDYDVNMCGTDYKIWFNTASVVTGEISSYHWATMRNYTGLFQLAQGNVKETNYGDHFLFFRPGNARNAEDCLKEAPVLKINGPKIDSNGPHLQGPKGY